MTSPVDRSRATMERPDLVLLTTAAVTAIVALRARKVDPEPPPLRRPLSAWVASGRVAGTRTRA